MPRKGWMVAISWFRLSTDRQPVSCNRARNWHSARFLPDIKRMKVSYRSILTGNYRPGRIWLPDSGITWFWIRPILSSIQCSPLQKSVERRVFTIRKEAWCMAPEANPTMLLSGQTTRRNISTLSSLIWDMRSETVPHCARMNILPASWIRNTSRCLARS